MGRLSIVAQAVFETAAPDMGGRKWLAWVTSLGVLGALFVADYLLGSQIRISIVYLFPILLITWNAGKRAGIVMSCLAASATTFADRLGNVVYPHLWIPVTETTLRTVLFVAFALILGELRRALDAEAELARIDVLTGVANRRSFVELTEVEISRANRYHRPLTVAYIDIDEFKHVNDRYGHQGGDELLKKVAATMRESVRRTDLVARLGGDEFAISLPEAGEQAGRLACDKLREVLLSKSAELGWGITFSIGVVTYEKPPRSVDEVIHRADQLMYSVKRTGKNMMAHEVVGENGAGGGEGRGKREA